MNKILIIDDEINIGLILSKFLTRNGFEVVTSTNGTNALELMSKETFNLVLCDFRLEDTDGREMLRKIKTSYPDTGVIIITGYSDIKLAVELKSFSTWLHRSFFGNRSHLGRKFPFFT